MQDVSSYCREIETYLCRKNEGHLIRIVGPAFELVSAWHERGVPLRVAFRGVDRCCERHHKKGTRRRPVRIEFCEADVLDAFDQWRRTVGVVASADSGSAPSRKPALGAHLDRVIARLTALRSRSPGFDRRVSEIVRELDRLADGAKHARGDARAAVVARLGELDDELLDAAVAELDPNTVESLRREAAEELAPFAGRLAAEAHARALDAAFRRLVRDSAGLPVVGFE
jgi:hypothetical protein